MAELLLIGHAENGVKRHFYLVSVSCCHNPVVAGLGKASDEHDPEDVLPCTACVCGMITLT
jgi:hypothetical protein